MVINDILITISFNLTEIKFIHSLIRYLFIFANIHVDIFKQKY